MNGINAFFRDVLGAPVRMVRSSWGGVDHERRRMFLRVWQDEVAGLPATTRAVLVEARLGQGRYRRQLLDKWKGACAVTGCAVHAALRASHCKPWRECNNAERLDANNGLRLVARLGALFDAGLIAVADDGAMLVSHLLSAAERQMLGLPAPLRLGPTPKQARYLQHHRGRLFTP